MAADRYLIQRCGTCGVAWRDESGKVIHPDNLSCSRYLPAAIEPDDLDRSIAVNMGVKYDPRQLRINPADACPPTHDRTPGVIHDTPSFRIPRPVKHAFVQAFGVPVNTKELDS